MGARGLVLILLLLRIGSTAPATLFFVAVLAVLVAIVFSIALWGTERLRRLIALDDRRLSRRGEIAGPWPCPTESTRERAAATEATSEAS